MEIIAAMKSPFAPTISSVDIQMPMLRPRSWALLPNWRLECCHTKLRHVQISCRQGARWQST
jgi:hypothetical protein